MKIKTALQGERRSSFRRYRDLFYGTMSLGCVIRAELLTALCGNMSGAAGLFLRSRLFPGMLGRTGRGVLFGRNISFRHPRKIRMGNNVIIDDHCLIDAKGENNDGIIIEDDVFIGRNTIIYCKNGSIRLCRGANISSNCTIFSSNSLTVGAGTMIGAYTYLLSGGEYDYADTGTPFAEQTGMGTRGPLRIGANCWLGARVTVLDAANIGDHCAIGAGAVVTGPIPTNSLALGVPARVVKSI